MASSSKINFEKFVPAFDKILERGLSNGVGNRDGQMCVEAAVCAALDLPHGDDPQCVEPAVREFKIILNDAYGWESPQSRARGLRDIGIAQVGSKGVVDGRKFAQRLAEETIRQLIPTLFRELWPKDKEILKIAEKCKKEGSAKAARAAWAAEATEWAAARAAEEAEWAAARAAEAAAWAAARVAWAAEGAEWAADAAARGAAGAADAAARAAASNGLKPEKYLLLSAKIALDVLRELGSPGVEWLERR